MQVFIRGNCPMIASENAKLTKDLRASVDEWPMTRPAYTYVLP